MDYIRKMRDKMANPQLTNNDLEILSMATISIIKEYESCKYCGAPKKQYKCDYCGIESYFTVDATDQAW